MTTTTVARQIGARAHAAILEPDTSWSVLAPVTGAVYIESDAAEILWLAASRSALHSRAILLPHMPDRLPIVGTGCSASGNSLCVGEDLAIELRDAEIWASWSPGSDGASASEAVLRIAFAIDRAALRAAPRGPLAEAMFRPVPTDGGASAWPLAREVVSGASAAVEFLCRIPDGPDLPEKLRDADGLVGLGQGLTPSGDDLLGGFLYTLRMLDSAHRGLIGVDWKAVDAWLQAVRSSTNKISFTILTDHAHGEAAGPLQDLLAAALGARSAGSLLPLVARVAGIGQSSGWDMLVGVRCACSLAARILDRHCAAASISSDRVVAQTMRQEFESRKEVVRVH